MRQVNSFEAVDGRLFKTEKECLDYEKSIIIKVEKSVETNMIVQGVAEEYNYTTTTYKGAKKRTETTIDTTLNISGVWRVHLHESLMYFYAENLKPENWNKDLSDDPEGEFITKALNMLMCVFSVEKANKRLCEIRSEILGCHAHIESDGNVIKVGGMPDEMLIEYIRE